MRTTRVRVVAIALVAAGALALPASSFAAATVERFSVTVPIEPEPIADTCAGPGVVGIVTGTVTESGQTVETDTGFHSARSLTYSFRVDFPDGSYLVAAQREPLTFSANPLRDQASFGGTLLERGTLYDANDVLIGYEMFHARFRTAIVNSTAVVEFDEVRLSCRFVD
jgi:hypothetical protein